MRIGKVIGKVTLSRCHPTFQSASLRVVRPLMLGDLQGETQADEEPLVSWCDLGSGRDDLVAISEGGEAAQPFRPHDKPVDAYNAAILDSLDLEQGRAAKGSKKKK